jgi:stage III sporulation protein SpoIIIAA
MERRITDDIHELKRVLPLHLTAKLDDIGNIDNLLEVVLDLGRIPTARYIAGEVPLADHEVTREELDAIVDGIGMFDADNRAGIERTLHRISAIRNRRGEVVGLTCRVGRAVYGTIDIIQDLVETGQSILMLGPPGVGKTTMLREAARVLAETKRVIIVDTSNEIGGDGDVPHPAVGKARRMQVATPERQHEVMIEAVENHNPEVIVIDEIGRELEATAARTIAERGVQLIGTAHGNALDNLMLNPTLSDLIGGIQSVTLGDDEARRRGTQKTVLERRAPPTFDVLIEIQTRDRLIVHEDVAAAVDAILRDRTLPAELRARNEAGEVIIESVLPEIERIAERNYGGRDSGAERSDRNARRSRNGNGRSRGGDESTLPPRVEVGVGSGAGFESNGSKMKPISVYAYGVARNRLYQAAKRLHVPLTLTDDAGTPDMIVTLKNYYRRRPKLIVDAERRGTPIFVLRANTVTQMENFLMDVFQADPRFSREDSNDPFGEAMRETETAIKLVRAGQEYVDLQPRPSSIRRRQHELAHKARLDSESFGDEPLRRVRIHRRLA